MADHHGFDWETAFVLGYRVAYGVLRDAARAEEVAQEACVKALVKIDSFEGRCPFPGWVRVIALNLALNVKPPPPGGIDPDELPGNDDPEATAISWQATKALHRCLSELTERQRLIFLTKHLDGMKGAEVAAEMHISEGAVWATLHQAAAKLRTCLAGQGIDQRVLH